MHFSLVWLFQSRCMLFSKYPMFSLNIQTTAVFDVGYVEASALENEPVWHARQGKLDILIRMAPAAMLYDQPFRS